MKKLNRKGFTLVELLAVIVILAIVVGITLVTVLPTLKDSRQEAFELTAQTAADFVEKEYQLSLIGLPTKLTFNDGSIMSFTQETIKAAGLKPENYIDGTYYIDTTTGRACVKLYASTNESVKNNIPNLADGDEAGEYYDAKANDDESSDISVGGTTGFVEYSMAQSTGCE